MSRTVVKIVSGGQTGADQGGLDAAIALGIEHGGWCPQGRLSEAGPIPSKYKLRETRSAVYSERTEKNVVDSDGTLVVTRGTPTGGTAYTVELAKRHARPYLVVDLERTNASAAARAVRDWLAETGIATLNVAGPRASKSRTMAEDVRALLVAALGD